MHASHPAALISTVPARTGQFRTGPSTRRFLESIGHTPLLTLDRLAVSLPGTVGLRGKAEFYNPSGSVKDRAAAAIVREAIDAGALDPTRVLVDATSGNTGVSYAMLGARLGFGVELFVPANARPSRLARMRELGARVHLTDPLEGTDGAQRRARERAEADPERVYYPDQYNHPANPRAHFQTTGPEIWEQTGGRVTHLVAGIGTGGTLSGTGRFLKQASAAVRVVGVQPDGPMHNLEGLKHLATAHRPGTFDAAVVDELLEVPSEAAEAMRGRLAREQALHVGNSAAAAVWAAVAVARRVDRGLVVAILPDGEADEGVPR